MDASGLCSYRKNPRIRRETVGESPDSLRESLFTVPVLSQSEKVNKRL